MSTDTDLKARRPRRGRWVLWLLATMLLLLGGFLALTVYLTGVGAQGFMPPQMAAAYHTPRDVVGDLGGMPVTIPSHVPHLVEYDGDPGWEPRPGWRPPERTHASRLKSFGVHVRYPDMATLSTPELRDEFRRRRLYQHHWLDLSIYSGKRYPGHGFLDRLSRLVLADPDSQYIGRQYVPLPSTVDGLELYAKRGINPQTGRPNRYEWSDGDVFIHRNHQGRVTTHIKCTFRRGTELYSSCQQNWSMESHGLSIDLRAYYPAALLPQWRDIQDRTSQFVLGFRSADTPLATPSPR